MKIVFVDGYKIRQTLDTDFPILDRHETDPTYFDAKYFIPPDEIWVDHRFKKELDFLLSEEEKITYKKGKSYQERRREIVQTLRKNHKVPEFKLSREEKEGLKIFHVDGSIVRKHIDPEFIFGGHDLVYDYVPKNEVWLDELMDPLDLPHVLLHETTERKHMEKGMSYDAAHDIATAFEKASRRKFGATYPGDANYPPAWTKEYLTKIYYISSE